MSPLTSDNHFDVVIVGAGVTGLTVAYEILKRDVGLNILILEKNDTVGGRILGENDSQAFYGSNSQTNVATFLHELRIKTEMSGGGDDDDVLGAKELLFLRNDAAPANKPSRYVSGQVYHFLKLVNSMSTRARYNGKTYAFREENCRLARTSVNELMRKIVHFPRARRLCASLLYACCPGIGNLEQVSALWFLVTLNGAGGLFEKLSATLAAKKRFFIEGGFASLVETLQRLIMEQGGGIRLRENVVKIETINGESVYVTTDSNKFKCDCIVIAVPPPANARIIMDATLIPEALRKSQKFHNGGTDIFFHATYPEGFWPASSVLLGTEAVGPKIIYDASHGTKNRVIAGFSSSGNLEDVFVALKHHFPAMRESACSGHGWSSQSPVNFIGPGSIENHANPMFLSLDRIFFASSELATAWPGTVDGAVEAAKRVACSVLFRTRPQALRASEILVCSKRYANTRVFPNNPLSPGMIVPTRAASFQTRRLSF